MPVFKNKCGKLGKHKVCLTWQTYQISEAEKDAIDSRTVADTVEHVK